MDEDDLSDEETLFVTFKASVNAIRVLDRQVQPLKMNLKVDIVEGDQATPGDQLALVKSQLSMAKIRYWLTEVLEGSILMNRDNDWALNSFMGVEDDDGSTNQIVILPGEPTEDLLIQILQSKLQAFGGEILQIGSIELDSNDGSGLSFTYIGEGEYDLPTNEEWVGERAYFDKPWWSRDDSSTMDAIADEDDDLEAVPNIGYSLEFLINDFKNAQTPSARVIRPDFKPKVIQGGKE